jgi:predicted dehydrogenase
MLDILFCGLGSIGTRHAKLIQANFDHRLFAYRTRQGQHNSDLKVAEFSSWDEVREHRFDVAFITNPTYLHLEQARKCVQAGMNLFIEKPIDSKTDGLDSLIKLCAKKNVATYVAYPFRHHPIMNALKQELEGQRILHSRMVCASYLPNWRSKQNNLFNYSAFKEQGGGIVLELSHEIDSAAFLFGEIRNIQGHYDKRGSVTRDSEDCADLLVFHKHGVTNVHMNFLSPGKQRFVEVDTTAFFIRADFVDNTLTRINSEGKTTRTFSLKPDQMYTDQLSYFFNHLNDLEMDNSLAKAGNTFRKIIEFKENHENAQNSQKSVSIV